MKYGVIILLYSCLLLIFPAQVSADLSTLTLENTAHALVYVPANETQQQYGLLVALHGMRQTEQATYEKWKKVADKYHMILLCPQGSNFQKGYTREPQDDRRNILQFTETVLQLYPIDHERIIISGFSRGGNFAIEMGILYPNMFRNVVCMFGFFNIAFQKKLSARYTPDKYKNSNFYFYTGSGDTSELSLVRGNQLLKKYALRSTLYRDPNLKHRYPKDMLHFFNPLHRWFF